MFAIVSCVGALDAKGVARRALLVSAVLCTVLAALNASRSLKGLFEFLLLLATSSSLWFYFACALAALRLNVARPAEEHVDRMWGELEDRPSPNRSEHAYHRLLPPVPHLPAERQRSWQYLKLWPNIAFDI